MNLFMMVFDLFLCCVVVLVVGIGGMVGFIGGVLFLEVIG